MEIQNSLITGGTFNLSSSNTKGLDLLHEKIAKDAFHNSGERFDAPKCHPKSRKAVLDDIMRWIRQDWDKLQDILWLHGAAGAGKSAIAQTIAEMCETLGLLVASFFFCRTSSSRNNEKRLITSIAYQLTIAIPESRPLIESLIRYDPSIFDKSMAAQVETLIILPLKIARSTVASEIADKWPKLIIIDGLDECNGHSIQRSIIHTLSTALLRHRVPLILFVASRPEPHIRNAFNAVDISHSTHIALDSSYNPDSDIKEFFLNRFNEIRQEHPLAALIPESWPPADIIDRLVQKSSGQFIYASTVMKYLDSPKHKPMKRLDVIVKLLPDSGDAPYQELDALYTYIFSCVENNDAARQIMGFILFHEQTTDSPSPKFLESLFGLDPGDVHLYLSELHSILDIPPPTADNKPIRMFHASLGDFLLDKQRSGKYYLDPATVHTNIAQHCLSRISISINNLKLQESNGLATAYSIRSFAYHCSRASTTTDSDILKHKLMHSNLQEWFGLLHYKHLDIMHFFEWLKKVDDRGKLFRHVQNSWDQSLLAGLNGSLFTGNEVDLTVLLIFPSPWPQIWLETISAVRLPASSWYQSYAQMKLANENEAYCQLFINFFEDRHRSGKYHVNSKVYARTALGFILHVFQLQGPQLTFDLSRFIPDIGIEDYGAASETHFKSALGSMSTLLSMASPSDSLYSMLRYQRFEDESWDHGPTGLESLARFKSEVRNYLEVSQYWILSI